MALKRAAEQADIPPRRSHRHVSKRTRLSPSADEQRSDSSNTSTGLISEASALRSSPSESNQTLQSSVSSVDGSDDINEASESSDCSSDDSSSASESESDDDEVVTIGGPTKPQMEHAAMIAQGQDLRSRLTAFLPQLAEANELLAHSGSACNMEDVDDHEQHIEMDLGLGVLEEQRSEDDVESSSDDFGDGEEKEGSEHKVGLGKSMKSNREKENSVMDKLLGQQNADGPVGIEEVG